MRSGTEKRNSDLFECMWRQTLSAMMVISLSKIGATLIDGLIMASRYSTEALAAMGLVLPFGTLITLIGSLVSTGCQSVCAGAYAKGDVRASNRALATAFYVGLAASAMLTAGAYLLAGPVSAFLGADPKDARLFGETVAYLRAVSVGAAAMVLNLVLSPAVQLYAGGRYVRRATAVLLVSDVAFDVLAVVLGLGGWGIGLATSLANWLCVLILFGCVVSRKTAADLSPALFDLSAVGPMLRRGGPEAVKRLLRMGADIFTNYVILVTAADSAMAGKTFGNLFASLFTVPGLGAASAMYLLSGAFVSMQDEHGLFFVGRKQLLHLMNTIVLTVLSVLLTPLLTDLFLNADADTKRTAVVCIRCLLVQMPVYVCFEMVTSYLQSIGFGKRANAMSLLGQILLYLPLVALSGRYFGAPGVLLSAPAAMLATLVLFYAWLSLRLRRPAGLYDIMHVSECIRTDDADVIIRSAVRTMDDAVKCSEGIRTALTARGADPRTAFAAALFTEEICSNVILHGFRRGEAKRKPAHPREEYMSVFTFIREGVVTLRVSDNCVLFDPAEKLKSLAENERSPGSGIGLRLVFSMADEASYTSMLNMNHMLVRMRMNGSGATRGAGELAVYDERFMP